MANGNGNGNGVVTSGKEDPALDPVAMTRDRVDNLVNHMSSEAMDQLRQMRDETDNLMRSIKERQEELINVISEHARFCADAICAKVIIADTLQKLHAHFVPGATPTITQRPDK